MSQHVVHETRAALMRLDRGTSAQSTSYITFKVTLIIHFALVAREQIYVCSQEIALEECLYLDSSCQSCQYYARFKEAQTIH